MNGRLAHDIPRNMVPREKAIRSCCFLLAFLCAMAIFPVVTATSMPPPIGTFQALQAPESADGANSVPSEVVDTRAKTERLREISTEVEITNATDTSGHLHATDNVVKNLSKNVVVKSASTFQPANAEEDDASILDDDSTPTSAGPSSSEESRMEALRSMESVTIRPEEAVDDAKEQQQNFPKEHSGTLVARGPEPDRSRRPEYDFDNPTSGGTNVYIVAIVGVVPAAGAVIWCVRKMIAKKRENKENPDAPPAEEDDKQTVEQDPPTKYSYIQDAYNKMYAKTIGELMPTRKRRWRQGLCRRASGSSTEGPDSVCLQTSMETADPGDEVLPPSTQLNWAAEPPWRAGFATPFASGDRKKPERHDAGARGRTVDLRERVRRDSTTLKGLRNQSLTVSCCHLLHPSRPSTCFLPGADVRGQEDCRPACLGPSVHDVAALPACLPPRPPTSARATNSTSPHRLPRPGQRKRRNIW
ncbi:hypothetical protein MRX96_013797 [Rhipicephalus microplus]